MTCRGLKIFISLFIIFAGSAAIWEIFCFEIKKKLSLYFLFITPDLRNYWQLHSLKYCKNNNLWWNETKIIDNFFPKPSLGRRYEQVSFSALLIRIEFSFLGRSSHKTPMKSRRRAWAGKELRTFGWLSKRISRPPLPPRTHTLAFYLPETWIVLNKKKTIVPFPTHTLKIPQNIQLKGVAWT